MLLSVWAPASVRSGRVILLETRTGEQTTLVDSVVGGQFVPGPRDPLKRHLFVRAEDGLHAPPFDLARKTPATATACAACAVASPPLPHG